MVLSEDLRTWIILGTSALMYLECCQAILWGLRGTSPPISGLLATPLLLMVLILWSLLAYLLSRYQGFSFLLVAFLTFLLNIYGSAYLETQRPDKR